MKRKIPGKSMRKWCNNCKAFKDNPKNRINPKYCEECLNIIFIKKLKKRDRSVKR